MFQNRNLILREQENPDDAETKIDEKLHNILALFQNEKDLVIGFQREIEGKKKILHRVRENIEKVEKEVARHESLLYNIRLKLTGLNERKNAFKVQEENEKSCQFETFSTINGEQDLYDNLEKTIQDEKLKYAQELRILNQELFQFYKSKINKTNT